MWFGVYTGLTLSARIYKLYVFVFSYEDTKTSYAHHIIRVSYLEKKQLRLFVKNVISTCYTYVCPNVLLYTCKRMSECEAEYKARRMYDSFLCDTEGHGHQGL